MSNDRIVVDITDRSFAEIGDGPLRNVRGVRWSDPIDRAGTFSFAVPANDPWFDGGVIELRSCLARFYLDGVLSFTGIIESRDRSIAQDGTAMITYSGRSLLAELAEVSVDFLTLASGNDGVQNAPAQVLGVANFKLANNWTLATTSTTSNLTGTLTTFSKVYAKLAGESALNTLVKIADNINNHFVWSINERKIHWFGNAFPASGLTAGQGGHDPVGFESNTTECIIQSFSAQTDAESVITRVYPYGGGQGETRLTIQAYNSAPGLGAYTINRSGNYVQYNPENYPLKEEHVEFKDIVPISNTDADVRAAANALVLAAASHLAARARAADLYRMRVTRVPDVRALRPGLTIRVAYQDDSYNIDSDFSILSVGTSLADDGTLYHDLTISSQATHRPVTSAEVQASQMQQGKVFQSHQQMGPNVTTISYREALDDDYDANMRFWLGDEIAQIQQVLLRYRVDPLRSTVKTVGGAADVEIEVDVPDHTHSIATHTHTISAHTHSISSHTHEVPNHTHQIGASQGGGGRNVGVFTGGGLYYEGTDVGVVTFNSTSSGGTTSNSGGGGTSASGGGGTSAAGGATVTGGSGTATGTGTADISSAITADYGVFEESGANTYAVGDLAVAINGVTLPAGQRVDLGGGWYAFDLTDEVQNSSTLRPNSESNTVRISQTPGTEKSAQITAQIQVRAIIQSVSYS